MGQVGPAWVAIARKTALRLRHGEVGVCSLAQLNGNLSLHLRAFSDRVNGQPNSFEQVWPETYWGSATLASPSSS